jgi:hypothetical protein
MAKELKEGESVSRTRRIPLEDLNSKTVKKAMTAMRNSMNQIASRAREATQRGYRVETVQAITYDGAAVLITCALTCIEDDGEDDI